MIRIEEEFHTKGAAIEFLMAIRRKFPATKFGTNVRLGFDRIERLWSVSGHRFAA